MPSQETSHRYQDAVLWAVAGSDNYGDVTLHAAVEIVVRWTWRRSEVEDAQGNKIQLDAQALVDRRINVGSLVYLGTEEDCCGTGTIGDDLMQVKTYAEASDVKNRGVCRIIGLARYRDSFPQIVD